MFSPNFLAMMRAAVSAAPPAAKPTTMLMVFLGGKSCAKPDRLKRPSIRQHKTLRLEVLTMRCSFENPSKHTAITSRQNSSS